MRDEIKNFAVRFAFLKSTPFHPQWIAHRKEKEVFSFIGDECGAKVLDVGCSDQRIRRFMPVGSNYIGLDYYSTATQWYLTRPAVYGDAHALPFRANEFDSVLLLDVIEHLRKPDNCMNEIYRVLNDGGKLFLKVPFLYPIHDAPFDFRRWTKYGLMQLASDRGFRIISERHFGAPLETAALFSNIAYSKVVLRWVNARHPLALLGLFLPVAVIASNLISVMLSKLSSSDDMMPHGYMLILEKDGALVAENVLSSGTALDRHSHAQ